ncbi:MAG: hypothetical protein IJ220_04535 [Clostridia bacterium]|nr:hypothetical protein [Clostridia bacterium]
MDNRENKDITEQYNDLKAYNKMIRDEERNQRMRVRNKQLLIKRGIILLIIAVIFALVIYPIFKMMHDFRLENLTFNVQDKVDFHFKGSFKLVSPEIDINQDVMPNGYYVFEDKNGIVFNVHKKERFITTDYDDYLYQMYLMDYIKEKQPNNITYETETYDVDGRNFFRFKYGIRLDSYANIDSEIETKVIELIKYMDKRSKKDFDFEAINYITNVYLNDFSVPIYYHEYNLLGSECVKNKIKVGYLDYLMDKHLTDDDVTQDDIDKYYRPEDLVLIINDKKITHNSINTSYDEMVHFLYDKMDYSINLYTVVKEMESMPFTIEWTTSKLTGSLVSFVYNGKTYYLDGDLYMTQKGNRVSYTWTIKMLEDFFGARAVYDYDNKQVNIIVPVDK